MPKHRISSISKLYSNDVGQVRLTQKWPYNINLYIQCADTTNYSRKLIDISQERFFDKSLNIKYTTVKSRS